MDGGNIFKNSYDRFSMNYQQFLHNNVFGDCDVTRVYRLPPPLNQRRGGGLGGGGLEVKRREPGNGAEKLIS